MSFFQQWPNLLHQEELVRHQSSLVERTFQETPTRHAFSSVSTELHELRQAVATTNSQLSVITRRTEPFSPSKCRPHCTSELLAPEFISSQAVTSESKSCNNPPIHPPVSGLRNPASPALFSAPTPPPQFPAPQHLNSLSATASGPCPVAFTPSPSNLLTPLTVKISSHTIYHVLPLSLPVSLGQPSPQTQQDLILPPCSAFSDCHGLHNP